MTTQCYVYEFTLSKRELAVGDVHALLRPYCKAYTFQLERGDENGYLHYQGRLSLIKKKRTTECAGLFADTGIHVSPTSKNAREGEAFYCMKAETRVEGPWTEKDFKPPKRKLKCIVKMEEEGLMPWQKSILEKVEGYDSRHIHVLVDTKGNNGKTWLMKWVQWNDLGQIIPPMYSAEDLIGFSMSFPDKPLYVVDMPRAMKKAKLSGFYSGIETIKNGILYDKRYHGKFHLMDEPQIIVCTNKFPPVRYLSKDRWKFYDISKTKQLIRLDLANYAQEEGSSHNKSSDSTQEAGVQEASIDSESGPSCSEESD